MSSSPFAAAARSVTREFELQFADEEQLDELREKARTDPVWYCREVLRFEPWSKQREIIESVRDNKRTAVRSCHGAGKTGLAARTALWFLAAFEHSKVITTAPTWSQVEEQLWREIHGSYHTATDYPRGVLTKTKLDMGDDWFAIGLSTDRPERFQGHHAEHLLLVVDEASGVQQEVFDAAEGFLTAPGARLLLIGNPTQLAGEFYDAFHTGRTLYNTIAISAFETPNLSGEKVPEELRRRLVSKEWVEEHRQKWGASPLWQVRVLGEFPSLTDDTIIPLVEVEAAHARELEPEVPFVVACDVARFGSDETVICVRRGHHVRLAATYRKRSTMHTVGKVIEVVRGLPQVPGWDPLVVIDDVGLGGGVTDRLREVLRGERVRVRGFNGGERPMRGNDYPNRRSEAWFAFAEMLPELDLDADDQLAADLVAPKYALDSRGRRVVEPKEQTKKRLGRSPDRGDAVILACATYGGRLPMPSDDPLAEPDPLVRRRSRRREDAPVPYGGTL